MRLSSWVTCFSLSMICWPRAIKLNSDWLSDFSSISAWASDAVRSLINWPCASRFLSAGALGAGLAAGEPEGGGVGVGVGVGVGIGALLGPAAGAGLADAEGEAPTESARAPVGANRRPPTPARPSSATATLRPRARRSATEGREFTALPKSLQLLRHGPLLLALTNPKNLPPRAPSCPIRIRTSAQSAS